MHPLGGLCIQRFSWRTKLAKLYYLLTKLPCLEKVHNSRVLESAELTKLYSICSQSYPVQIKCRTSRVQPCAHQNIPGQTQLVQQTTKSSASAIGIMGSPTQLRRAKKQACTRVPHQDPTPSGQAIITVHTNLTTASLPKQSSTQSTQRPLFQDWEGQLFHLIHKNKHKVKQNGRQKICPK